MTAPPIRTSEWWALVDPMGEVLCVRRTASKCWDFGENLNENELIEAGFDVHRVLVTEAPEVER